MGKTKTKNTTKLRWICDKIDKFSTNLTELTCGFCDKTIKYDVKHRLDRVKCNIDSATHQTIKNNNKGNV